jgi:O-antigen/teichoic acid export membrane protein
MGTMSASEEERAHSNRLRQGVLGLAAANLIQMATGYLANIWIGRQFGPQIFGMFSVAMTILLLMEVGPASGIPDAVKKYVAHRGTSASAIMATAGALQVLVVAFFFATLYLSAPLLGRVFADPTLGGYLRLSSPDIWFYGFLFLLLGLQNGLREFRRQALLQNLLSGLRLGLVFLLVTLTGSITGAFLAKIATSAVCLLVAFWMWRRGRSRQVETPSVSVTRAELVAFSIPVLLFAIVINLFLSLDVWLVHFFIGGSTTGYYSAASTLSKAPYFISLGLSTAVFPVLSQAVSVREMDRVRALSATSLEFLLLLLLPVAALTMSYGTELMVFFYGPEYQQGGAVLGILMWGHGLLAVFTLLITILNAVARPGASLVMAALATVIDLALGVVLIPRFGMTGAATGTLASMAVVSAIALGLVVRKVGAIARRRTLASALLASGLVLGLSRLIRVQGLTTLFVLAGLMALYCGILLLTGALSVKELLRRTSIREDLTERSREGSPQRRTFDMGKHLKSAVGLAISAIAMCMFTLPLRRIYVSFLKLFGGIGLKLFPGIYGRMDRFNQQYSSGRRVKEHYQDKARLTAFLKRAEREKWPTERVLSTLKDEIGKVALVDSKLNEVFDGADPGLEVAVQFSGGCDSTLIAMLAAQYFRKVHMVSFTHSLIEGTERTTVNAKKVIALFGEEKVVHRIIDSTDVFRSFVFDDYLRDLRKYKTFVVGIGCLACKLSFDVKILDYALSNGIKLILDGADLSVRTQLSQGDEGILRERGALFARYGVDFKHPAVKFKNNAFEMLLLGLKLDRSVLMYAEQPECRGNQFLNEVYDRFYFLPKYGIELHSQLGRQWLEDKLPLCRDRLDRRAQAVASDAVRTAIRRSA